jgi:hypothetical protein
MNGTFWNNVTMEYEVLIAGEVVGWASTQHEADERYFEALRVRREHAQRCPADNGNGLAPGVDY